MIPYVYFIKNKTTGLKYIGVRFANKCQPNDLWTTYFTSSLLVKKLINHYGKDDFEFKVLKKFNSKFEAIQYEQLLLKTACIRKDYLNIHSGYNFQTEKDFKIHLEKRKMIGYLSGKLQESLKIGFFGYTEEKKKEICSMGGRAAKIVNEKNKSGIFSEEVRRKQHETLRKLQISAYYNPELRKKICSKGGKNGNFSKNYYEKLGLSEEDRINAQRERGKKGGPKNKGFIWYNDGKNIYKYTKKQQEIESFEKFLEKNPKFKKGKK